MARYLAFLFRIKHAVLGLLGAVALVSCAGLLFLTVTSDTRVFFAPDNPHLLQLQTFERTYSENNNVLFVVTTDTGSLVTTPHLAALQALTEDAWQLPHSLRVDSITNFQDVRDEQGDIVIGDLVEGSGPWNEAELASIRKVLTTDPALTNRLISTDLSTTGINVNFSLPKRGSDTINEINAATRALAETFEKEHPDLKVYVTGNVVLMQAFSLAAMKDVRLLVPLAMLVILIVLMLTLRSLRQTLALASILGLSAAIATSLLGWAGHAIDIATVVAPVIIMTLAMASCVHVVTAINRHSRAGVGHLEAITAGLKENLSPIFLTSLTTAIGFISLNFADAPPFNVLGNLVVVGILINFVFTFTLLPILLSYLPSRQAILSLPTDSQRLTKLIHYNRWPVLIIGVFLIVTASLGIAKVKLDDDFIRYFDKSFAYRLASDVAEDRLTGLNIIEFDLDTHEEDGIFDPDYQRTVAEFATWLRGQDQVTNVTAITDLTKKLHRILDPEAATIDPLPRDRTQIAQYFLLMNMSLPEGRSLSEVINTDQSASRLTIILRGATSGDVRAVNTRATEWLRNNAPELAPKSGMEGISINVLFSYLSITNIKSMINGTIFSFLAISIVIALLLRSLSLGFVSLIANTVPALVGFGLWGLLVGTVNLGASVLVAMTLGIVVDDTIHYLTSFIHQRKTGKSRAEAAAGALLTVGPAMLITTVALIAGFAVLSLSGFDVNRTLGTFTAIIIAVALVADLSLLPSVLTFGRKTAGKPQSRAE